MANKGRLIIISAPSGTGKTSVIKCFLKIHSDMIHSVSCTTRPMRKGEINGKDYHFIDKETFQNWIENNKLAEWATYCDNYYGTPKEPLDLAIEQGKDVLLDLEVVGGMQLKNLYKDNAISIFLLPPNEEELKRRLLTRGTDSRDAQEKRLKTALEEIKYKDKYDFQVINDNLDKACIEIENILK